MSQMYSLGSGSRWEPTATDAAASAEATEVGTAPPTRSRLQPAALVTGAAAVVLLAGALGGFAVGRASTDDEAPAGTSTSSGTDVSWYVVDATTTRSA